MKTLKNFNLTDSAESIAWNGTLVIVEDEQGQKVAKYHSGVTTYNDIVLTELQYDTMSKLSGHDAVNYFLYLTTDKLDMY